MTRVHANNFETVLNGAISDSATSITLTSVTNLPAIGGGITCNLTIEDGGLNEIVTATAASGFVLTITRAQEGTTAKAFGDGSSVSIRATRDSIDTKQDVISGLSISTATVASTDKVLIQDVSDSNNLKTVTAQSIADLAASSGGSVPNGGTGLSVSTPYALLCGGTTSTSALQYVSGVGTAGQVLTSNGASALPTWQSVSAGTGSLLGITDIKDSNNNKSLNITATAFAINYIDVINSATGTFPTLAAAGTDTNIGLILQGKGNKGVTIAGSNKKLTVNAIDIWVGTQAIATNTAVGTQALVSTNNSSASNSTALGYLAGSSITTGSDNTCGGASCGSSISSGAHNTLYGSNSGGGIVGGSRNTVVGSAAGESGASGGATLGSATDNTCIGYRATCDTNSSVGCIAIGVDSVAAKATGATSSDNGPGIAIGSAAAKVGFRGDGTIYSAAGASAGYWRVKINGTVYKLQLFADV